MIRLKVNAGKVLNNIDKRVIPSKYVPKKIAELVKDYPEAMQTDFRDYLDLSGSTTIDPNTVELDEQSGCLILTSKTREGFQYTTDEMIQIVQDWLAESFEYGASNSLTARTLMVEFEYSYKDGKDTENAHKPDAIIAIRDFVQGMAFTENHVALSISMGPINSKLAFYKNPMNSEPECLRNIFCPRCVLNFQNCPG